MVQRLLYSISFSQQTLTRLSHGLIKERGRREEKESEEVCWCPRGLWRPWRFVSGIAARHLLPTAALQGQGAICARITNHSNYNKSLPQNVTEMQVLTDITWTHLQSKETAGIWLVSFNLEPKKSHSTESKFPLLRVLRSAQSGSSYAATGKSAGTQMRPPMQILQTLSLQTRIPSPGQHALRASAISHATATPPTRPAPSFPELYIPLRVQKHGAEVDPSRGCALPGMLTGDHWVASLLQEPADVNSDMFQQPF